MNRLTDLCFTLLSAEGAALWVTFAAAIAAMLLMWVRAPKRICYLLTLLVVVRLLIPQTFFSPTSAFNQPVVQEFVRRYTLPEQGRVGDYRAAVEGSDSYDLAVRSGLQPESSDYGFRVVYFAEDPEGRIVPPATFRETYGKTLVIVWVAGVAVVWGYGLLSALLLRRRVATATILEPRVYESDRIQAPFILGFFRPVIYLPLGLDPEQRRMVLCHERMHLRWKDPQVKVIVYLTMGLHWMNPLLWLWFYRFYLELAEEACDQDALQLLGPQKKADYSEVLLAFASRRQLRGATTVAFGESWVRDRVKAALKYKKPLRAVTVLASVLAVLAALSLTSGGVRIDGAMVFARRQSSDRQTGVLQLDLCYGSRVEGMTLDLELWSADGLTQTARIYTQKWMPKWWRTQTARTLNLTYSVDRDDPLLTAGDMNWAVQFESRAPMGSIPLPAEYPYQRLLDTDPETLRKEAADGDSLIFPIALLSQEENAAADWQLAYDRPEDLPIGAGQLALVARLRMVTSIRDDAYRLDDVFPQGVMDSSDSRAVWKGASAPLSDQQRQLFTDLLRQLEVTSTVDMGQCRFDPGDDPWLELTDPQDDRHRYQLAVSDFHLMLWDARSGQLTRIVGDPLQVRQIALFLHRALDRSVNAREVLLLPDQTGQTANGWTLLAALPQNDVFLYADEARKNGLLVVENGCYPIHEVFLTDIALSYQDFSGDGRPELAMIGTYNEDEGQRLYFYSQFDPDRQEYRMDCIFPSDVASGTYLYILWTNYLGDSADPDFDTFSLSAWLGDAEEPVAEVFFSKQALLGEDHISFRAGDDVQKVRYRFEEGSIRLSAEYSLRGKVKEETVLVPCLSLSVSIRWDGEDQGQLPFRFFDCVMAPLT